MDKQDLYALDNISVVAEKGDTFTVGVNKTFVKVTHCIAELKKIHDEKIK